MTQEQTGDRDPRFEPDRSTETTRDEPRDDEEHGERPAADDERSPWTREGADAPDAADIAEPDEQL
jgi:hypothetical protein